MGLLPIPAPKLTQGASRAGFWRAAALYDKRLPPPSFRLPHVDTVVRRWLRDKGGGDTNVLLYVFTI